MVCKADLTSEADLVDKVGGLRTSNMKQRTSRPKRMNTWSAMGIKADVVSHEELMHFSSVWELNWTVELVTRSLSGQPCWSVEGQLELVRTPEVMES